MKLRLIIESDYAGLEDADQFGDIGEELTSFIRLLRNAEYIPPPERAHSRRSLNNARNEHRWSASRRRAYNKAYEILNNYFDIELLRRARADVDYNILLSHKDIENANNLINMIPELKQWWDSVAAMPERLHQNYGKQQPGDLEHLGIKESEYEGLEDADEFGRGVEFLGEGHLGPHVFRVYYHTNEDWISMEINRYELSPWADEMSVAMKRNIINSVIHHRPDLLKYMTSKSENGKLYDIGMALVDPPQDRARIMG